MLGKVHYLQKVKWYFKSGTKLYTKCEENGTLPEILH